MDMEIDDEEAFKIFLFEYHQRAFYSLNKKLKGYDICSYHPIRDIYWKNVPQGVYSSDKGIKLVKKYITVLDSEIGKIISKNSIAYWIHLLRRIACTLAQCDDDRERASVVGLVRCIFEASIQKYAKIEQCNRVGLSDELEIEDILGGFFVREGTNEFEEQIIKNPQLVLTNFGINELKEFYELEKLVFELWRSAANLRGFNKGSLLEVTHNPGDIFELRDKTLEKSIKIYDDRHSFDFEGQFTAKGTIYELISETDSIWSFVPVYNVSQINTKQFIERDFKFFSDMDVVISNEIISNFILIPTNLQNYFKSNYHYSKSFEKLNKVNLESVIAVLVGILMSVRDKWNDPSELFKYYQRGYEGPYKKEDIYSTLKNYLPVFMSIFGFKEENIDIEKGMLFWTLTDEKRDIIDLTYPGPHSIFLPYGKERLFIDYAWINRRLFDLFWSCNIDDENFKGTALEFFIQKQNKMALPTKPCKSYDGEERQIDASFQKNNILLIVECKAINRSIAFDRGNKDAIQFRKNRYDEAINQVDEKAKWLIRERKGTNFEINKYNKIIPIVITPFKEYIRTDERKYWLSDKIPRILTPFELIEMMENDKFWNADENALFIE